MNNSLLTMEPGAERQGQSHNRDFLPPGQIQPCPDAVIAKSPGPTTVQERHHLFGYHHASSLHDAIVAVIDVINNNTYNESFYLILAN